MKLHGNARSCPASRRLMCERVEDGWTVEEAADAAGFSQRCAYRWLARWRGGDAELADRSSAPQRVAEPHAEDGPGRHRAVASVADDLDEDRRGARAWRSRRWVRCSLGSGCIGCRAWSRSRHRTGIAADIAGELIHVDVKKLGRFDRPGHRVTGDVPRSRNRGAGLGVRARRGGRHAARLAYVEVLTDECGPTTRRVLATVRSRGSPRHGVTVERIMSDNGTELPLDKSSPRSAPNSRSVRCFTQPVSAAHQRQSGTVHPDHAARVGLRAQPTQQLTQRRTCTPTLARLLQPPTTTQRPRPPSHPPAASPAA